jgi:hypothetical protein
MSDESQAEIDAAWDALNIDSKDVNQYEREQLQKEAEIVEKALKDKDPRRRVIELGRVVSCIIDLEKDIERWKTRLHFYQNLAQKLGD